VAASKKIFAQTVYILFSRILYTGKRSQSVIDKTQPLKRTFFSSVLKMRLLFAACFSVNLLLQVAIHGNDTGTESGTCDETNVCSTIKALETKLEAKLEKLIELVSPPGKLGLTDLH